MDYKQKIVDLYHLVEIRETLRHQGKKVVWTNGCFDLLHVGHVRGLYSAHLLGDVLIVGINSDSSVRQLKGSGRPFMTETHRAEIVAAIEFVDYIILFEDLTAENMLRQLKPDIHCKGAEYFKLANDAFDREVKIVSSYGGKVEYLPMTPSISTSSLIHRIRSDQI